MNVKIQCPCGSRYSFDVEPQSGRMPFAVNCPSCGADGTAAANALIAEAPASMPIATPVAIPVAVAVPLTPVAAPILESAETRRAVQDLWRKKKEAEQRSHRLKVSALWVVLLAVAAYAGFWGWYYVSGSKPHVIYQTTFGNQGEPVTQFIGPNRFVIADSRHAVLHDLKSDADVWSTTYLVSGVSIKPQIFSNAGSLWICVGNQVLQLDAASGTVKKTIAIEGDFESFTPSPANIVVVSAINAITRRSLNINLGTGDAASQDIAIAATEKHEMPNELPANVAPTASALEAQELGQKKFNQPLDAVSSRVLASGENALELRVKLIEPKVRWVDSVKPKATILNGETTASTSLFGVSDSIFNELLRSRGGGAKRIDESRYEVKLRRWNDGKPADWTGESIGPPACFPLKTVDLVACGTTLVALDKQGQFLFQATLSYPVADRYTTNSASTAPPAAEGPGGLYVADKGVLTAFSLPGGQVRWRLTTIGVTKIQFDADGALYVNSSTASPQDIQYSDQITFDKAKPVLIKMDPQTGRILWQKEGVGYDSYVSGKYLYASSANVSGVQIAAALGQALGNVPQSETPFRFHLYRINPATGQIMWDVFHSGVPDDLTFQDNKFVLCFDHDVQAWRSFSF